jgi:hypothetical protein
MEDALKSIVYSKNVVEFVTVANEYCGYIEQSADVSTEEFIDRMPKILSLLYLKALLLPDVEQLNDEGNEKFVTEFDWQFIKNGIEAQLNERDTYLDFFDAEMNETPEPVASSISENLADVYQDLKDFIEIYKLGNEILSNDAIFECKVNFNEIWGFRLVNSLRMLHYLSFMPYNENAFEAKKKISDRSKEWFDVRAKKDISSND